MAIGVAGMQIYRVYKLDDRGRIAHPPCEVKAANSLEALGKASIDAELKFGAEVWLGDQLVHKAP